MTSDGRYDFDGGAFINCSDDVDFIFALDGNDRPTRSTTVSHDSSDASDLGHLSTDVATDAIALFVMRGIE